MNHHPRNEIADLLKGWIAALETHDPTEITALYASDAILLPTVSNTLRKTSDGIRDYFEHFMIALPTATIIEQNIRHFNTLAINSGVYSFRFTFEGTVRAVVGRFTFVYRKDTDGWKIIEHHSSRMPED